MKCCEYCIEEMRSTGERIKVIIEYADGICEMCGEEDSLHEVEEE